MDKEAKLNKKIKAKKRKRRRNMAKSEFSSEIIEIGKKKYSRTKYEI